MKSKHLIADIAAKARALKNRAGEKHHSPAEPSSPRKTAAPSQRKRGAKKQ